MGGQSTGTWTVDTSGKFGVFDGKVVDVPSLKAPGFIKAAADASFPDASSAAAGDLVLTVRSSTPDFGGFRVSFASGTAAPPYSCAGGGSIPFSRGCFKAHFTVPAGDDFAEVRVPFHAFTDLWSRTLQRPAAPGVARHCPGAGRARIAHACLLRRPVRLAAAVRASGRF